MWPRAGWWPGAVASQTHSHRARRGVARAPALECPLTATKQDTTYGASAQCPARLGVRITDPVPCRVPTAHEAAMPVPSDSRGAHKVAHLPGPRDQRAAPRPARLDVLRA